jgi:EAL domain-containing protein (putative c-di-GMP-specific phosphodiesterase class I)
MGKPFNIENRELFVTTSLGIALYPDDGRDPHALLKNADTAMYRAKDKGRGAFCFYTADMNAQAEDRLTLENELRHALSREQFQLEFQPQVTLAPQRELIGVEALMRWDHPTRGLIGPDDFIPLLEETGLIISVGEWLIRRACEQLLEWERRGRHVPRIAINISPRQLVEPGFAPIIERVLGEYGVPYSRLELEITESILMDNQHGVIQVLRELSDSGVSIAMDDFGTGYSSLSYLRRLPIRTLKIDRSFVNDVPRDADDCELTRAIIAMGQNLNLQVLAEGVETPEQLAFLVKYGCHGAQGFLISHPVSADNILSFD